MKRNCLYHGDALELLAAFPADSVDAVVTHPPYSHGGLTARERMRSASEPGVFQHRVERPGVKLRLTGKPLALMDDLLRIVESDGCVLDPFAGSGTTLLAAQRRGLDWIGMEANESYCYSAGDCLGVERAHCVKSSS